MYPWYCEVYMIIACPIDRKLPLNDAAHVRNAMARFDQVISDKCHPREARRRIIAAAKKFADACPKFEAAMRLDPGMGIQFNLSDCYEQFDKP